MIVSARSLSVSAAFVTFLLGGVFLMCLSVLGTGDTAVRTTVFGVGLGGCGISLYVFAVTTVFLTRDGARPGWPCTQLIPVSEISRVQVVAESFWWVIAIRPDQTEVRLLRFAGTQLTSLESGERAANRARDKIEIWLSTARE